MKRSDSRILRPAAHLAGFAVLAIAWASGHALVAAGAGHARHEPARVYLLALSTFLLASAGVALAAMGQRLFAKVTISRLWLSHIPTGFGDTDGDQDEPRSSASTARSPSASRAVHEAIAGSSANRPCESSIST